MDRRSFLRTAGAGAAGAALLGASGGALADGGERPNVLVILLDSLRHDYVGAYGNSWIRTPNIDALARESLRFTRSFPEAMPTVPARRSFLLGRRIYPWSDWRPSPTLPHTPGWTGMNGAATTWLKTLREHGWYTGYVTDNPFLGFNPDWAGFRTTVDRFVGVGGQVGALRPARTISERELLAWVPRGIRTSRYLTGMRQYLANVADARDEHQSCAARVFTQAIDELGTALRRKPFALVVDSFDPHEPWAPPAKYRDLYGNRHYRGSEPGTVRYTRSGYYSKAVLERLPVVYGATVTMTDAWLGHFMGHFHASGLADDTVVVLLSDHGIVLGERGWTGKPALELHPELIHVPFLLRDPRGRAAGQTTPYFVSPHDVGATLLSMAGVPVPASMNGSDVSPLLDGRQPRRARPFWYGGYANHWYYRDDRWALIADGNNSGRELYDLQADPGERRNVARQNPQVLSAAYANVLHDAGVRRLPFFADAH
jgi:arylsulfatase A-like enzyme